jgi:hypothetical protein
VSELPVIEMTLAVSKTASGRRFAPVKPSSTRKQASGQPSWHARETNRTPISATDPLRPMEREQGAGRLAVQCAGGRPATGIEREALSELRVATAAAGVPTSA